MSSCRVFAFINVGYDYAFRCYEPPVGAPPPSAEYNPVAMFRHYRSVMSCEDATSLPVSIRPPLPGSGRLYPYNSTVYIVGDLFVRTDGALSLIDASQMYTLPVTALSSLQCDGTVSQYISSFPPPYVDVFGSISSGRCLLSDGSALIFVDVSQYVRNRIMVFQLASVPFLIDGCFVAHCSIRCYLSPSKHDIAMTELAHVGHRIRFAGTCSNVLDSGVLSIDADEVEFDGHSTALRPVCIRV